MADFQGLQIDPAFLPTMPPAAPKRNLFAAGLSSGVDELQGLLGSAAEYAGRGLGIAPLEQYGARVAERNTLEAQQNGRPDLEVAPWKDGGAPVLPWLAYQTTKQIPLLGAYLAGSALVPEAAVPAGLARLGAAAPRLIGGGGLEAGAGFAARRAALAEGQTFGRRVVAGEAVGIPLAAGSMYQEAKSAHPEGVSGEDMAKVAALSPVYAAADALDIPLLSGLKNVAGGIVKKVVKGSVIGAAEELVQEGVQTAMEQSFRTDLTPQQRMSNIVEGAVTGAAVGGVLGGMASVRRAKDIDPAAISTGDLKTITDEVLGLPAPGVGSAVAPNVRLDVNQAGTVTASPTQFDVQPDLQAPIIEARPQAVRAYEGATDPELASRVAVAENYFAKRKGNEPLTESEQELANQLQLMQAEVEIRNRINPPATNSSIPSEVAGAVERRSDVVGVAARNSAAPVPVNPTFEDERTTLFQGIAPRTRKLFTEATSMEELDAKLRQELENGRASKSILTLAERRGIDLNEPAKVATAEPGVQTETGTATSVATNTEPAAPANLEGGDQTADAEFQAKWQERIKGVKDFGLKELRGVKRLIPNVPANEEQAKLAIYDALGAVDREDTKVDGYKAVEQLAQEYDLVDDNGQLTDEGVRIARMRIPLEDTVKEAVSRGYNGVEANAFNKGALGERKVTLGSIGELQAYNAGKEWALDRNSKSAPIPATASNEQTETMLGERTAQKGGEHTVRSATVPEKQQRMQLLNEQIDKVYGTTLHPTEQAQLKRMVREGASKDEIDEAARYLASGRGALIQEQPERAPYRGEILDRGPLIRARERARVAAQEAALQQSTQRRQKEATASAIQEHNRYKAQLRQAIDSGVEDGSITRRQQIGMLHMLVNNNLKGVELALSATDDPQVRASRREFLAGVAASAAVTVGAGPVKAATLTRTQPSEDMRTLLIKGDANAVLKHIEQRSPNSSYRMIARKLLRGGIHSTTMALGMESDLYDGRTFMNEDGSTRIMIYDNGTLSEETILHELIHAYVGERWAGLRRYGPENKALLGDKVDRADAVVTRFQNLWDQISNALQKTNPELIDKEVWAYEIARNPDEMLSWVLTNPQAQAYLRTIDENGEKVAPEKSIWEKIVDFFRSILGLPSSGPATTALDQVLSAGYTVLDAGAKVQTGDFNRKFAAELKAEGVEFEKIRATGANILNVTEGGVKAVTNAGDRLRDRDGVKGVVRELTLGWMSVHGANEFFGKWFKRLGGENGVHAYEEALNLKNAIFARLSLMTTNVLDRYDQLNGKDRKSAEDIVMLMKASEFGINPMRPWKEQSETLRTSSNAKNLEQLTNKYHELYRKLLSRGHVEIYRDLNRVNDVQMLATLAMSLHQQVDAMERGDVAGFETPPMDAYMADQTTKDFTPQQARDWWAAQLDGLLKGVFQHLEALRTVRDNPNTDAKTQENMKSRIDPLGKRASDIANTVKALNEAPYFHLGRYGDYVVSWKVESAENLAKVADALSDAGYDGVITNGTDKLDVFMRVENITQQRNLHNLVKKLARAGVIVPESISARKRSKENVTAGVDLQSIKDLIASIENVDIDENDEISGKARQEMVDSLKARAIDLTPEISITRVLTKRKGIPGYSANMIRSFAWRSQVGINALAGQSVAPKITQAFVDMRGALKDVEESLDTPLNQRNGMRQIIDEYSRRESERARWPTTRIMDQLSGVATAWFLGFSASYGFVNTTQLGVTLLPELGARHGFAKAFGAIAKAAPTALKIMREVAKHGYKVSLDRAMDAVITQDALQKVVGKETAEYLMRVVNTGNLDIGGPSRELVRAAEGRGDEHLDRVLRYASSIGYYTETASRLIAALATRQLNPSLSIEDAAERAAYVINETMWNYSQTNQGRQFGKMGVFGRGTPLMLKFMQFQAQLTEKLLRETYQAIKGDTHAERSEARRYLLGHLSAMTVLAGSLGLPAATVFATVIDRLKDLWDDDDEPSNVRAAYRNWLADLVGVKGGELLSHGVFRAAGFDISQRIGEQDIVPFSRFLADRREMKDKTKDMAFRTWGAPTSLVEGLLEGGQQIADGNIGQGLSKMLPNAFAAPVKAYRLTQEGYVDTTGKPLPMEAGALDVMTQLLGFNPSVKAEYSEARQDQTVRKGQLVRQASNLRNQILDAVAQNDNDTALELISRAQQFDQANPAFAVLPRIGDTARRRARASEIAKVSGTPLGVSPKDLEGQQISRYANY